MASVKTTKPVRSKCPICGKPADAVLRPFCSKRCADVDLHRWLAGVYVVPVTETRKKMSAAKRATNGTSRRGEQ